MIHELYKNAGKLHGHYCPGLAIGVRAAYEALRLLEIEDNQKKGLYCIAESSACYVDGIQWVFGTTTGKNNLEVRPAGKVAFSFYDRANGTSIRLFYTGTPEGMGRDEMTEYILTAPFELLFSVGSTKFAAPEDKFVRIPEKPCSRCGESTKENFLQLAGDMYLCPQCREYFLHKNAQRRKSLCVFIISSS